MPGHVLPLQEFSESLRAARLARGLSVRDLAELSGVSFSLISALENGRRSGGVLTLKKLADALELGGRKRKEFFAMGKDTSCRHRLQVGEKRKGMQLLHKLLTAIAGIPPEEINDIILEYLPPSSQFVYDFVIRKHDGQLVAGEIHGDEIRIIPADPVTGMLPDPPVRRASQVGRVL